MSVAQIRAFRPLNNNVSAVITADGVYPIPLTPLGTRAIRIVNAGADPLFFEFGDNAGIAASATNSVAMLGNTVEVFTAQLGMTHIAVSGTSGEVYVTVGEGL